MFTRMFSSSSRGDGESLVVGHVPLVCSAVAGINTESKLPLKHHVPNFLDYLVLVYLSSCDLSRDDYSCQYSYCCSQMQHAGVKKEAMTPLVPWFLGHWCLGRQQRVYVALVFEMLSV